MPTRFRQCVTNTLVIARCWSQENRAITSRGPEWRQPHPVRTTCMSCSHVIVIPAKVWTTLTTWRLPHTSRPSATHFQAPCLSWRELRFRAPNPPVAQFRKARKAKVVKRARRSCFSVLLDSITSNAAALCPERCLVDMRLSYQLATRVPAWNWLAGTELLVALHLETRFVFF